MLRKRLHVSNLSPFTSEAELKAVFAAHGPVRSTTVVRDREGVHSSFFGIVEYEDDKAAECALFALNGSMLHGQLLRVSLAQPVASRTEAEASL